MLWNDIISRIGDFHFAQPGWLWALAALPLVWLVAALWRRRAIGGAIRGRGGDIRAFADAHLLPHLLAAGENGASRLKTASRRRFLGIWSLIWALCVVAMAGPRWDYTEVKIYTPAANLLILLDLSRSMDAQDVKPSRLARARQEIADIMRLAGGVNIGLIAYDSVPHVMTPLSDDRQTLGRLLPSLNTGLVYVPGSNLAPALARAGAMLGRESGQDKHILVISDGGFQDADGDILRTEQELVAAGIRVHVMGLGTAQGAPVPDGQGGLAKDAQGQKVIVRIQQDRMQRVATDGRGLYLDASYLEDDTARLLAQIGTGGAQNAAEKTTRMWEERFYIALIPALLLMLPWFRRHAALFMLALVLLHPAQAYALDWRSWFMNKEQQGQKAVEEGAYEAATEKFDDPYRKGVAQYKAGQYEQAARSFASSTRADVGDDARYNLGNAQLLAGEVEAAIKTYEDLLEQNPNHADAQHNLEIAKKMRERQNPPPQNQDQKNDQDQEQNKEQNNNPDQGQNQNQQESNQDKEGNQGNQGQPQNQDGDQSENDPQDAPPQENEGAQDQQPDQGQPDRQDQSQPDQQDQQDQQQQQGQNAQQDAPSSGAPDQETPQGGQSGQPSQQDVDADQWLSRIEGDTESFLKNKFYIESKRQNAQQGGDPW